MNTKAYRCYLICIVIILAFTILNIVGCSNTSQPPELGYDIDSSSDDENTVYQDIISLIDCGDLAVSLACSSISQGSIEVRNNTDRQISFIIMPGTYMKADNTGYQNMMIMSSLEETLMPNTLSTFTVDTCCMNIHRNIPSEGDTFALAVSEDEDLCKITEYFHDNQVDFPVRQAATWMLTSNATYEDCKVLRDTVLLGYVISEKSYVEAERLLKEVCGWSNDVEYDIGGEQFPGHFFISVPRQAGEDTRFDSALTVVYNGTRIAFYTVSVTEDFPSAEESVSALEDLGAEVELFTDELMIAGYETHQNIYRCQYGSGATGEEYYADYFITFENSYEGCRGIIVQITGETYESVAGDEILRILNTFTCKD